MAAVHEGKKPFKCEICEKNFANKTALTKHTATVHEEQKSFKCEICDYCCSQKRNMKLTGTTVP